VLDTWENVGGCWGQGQRQRAATQGSSFPLLVPPMLGKMRRGRTWEGNMTVYQHHIWLPTSHLTVSLLMVPYNSSTTGHNIIHIKWIKITAVN